MKTLTTYFIVKNEERNIRDCINSILSFSDEIIITDTGSIDSTKDVVMSFENEKIKLYDFEWCNNYSKARNFSLSKATCDYVLSMDADEIANEELQKEIIKFKENDFFGFSKISLPGYFIEQQNNNDCNFNRYIISREIGPYWVYPVHESLKYAKAPFSCFIDKGKIINNKRNNEILINFDKYCELYFNEFNSKMDYKKGSEFFYYVNFTVFNKDVFLAKKALSNIFRKDVIDFSEDWRTIIRLEGRQTRDESTALFLINEENTLNSNNLIKCLYDMTIFDEIDDFTKYYIYNFFYENSDNAYIKQYVNETNVKLALIELKYHCPKDFIKHSKGTYLEHDANILYNKMNSSRIIIYSDKYPSTLLYYASKYFYDIHLISSVNNINHDFDDIKFEQSYNDDCIQKTDDKKTLIIKSESPIYSDEFDNIFTNFINSKEKELTYFK